MKALKYASDCPAPLIRNTINVPGVRPYGYGRISNSGLTALDITIIVLSIGYNLFDKSKTVFLVYWLCGTYVYGTLNYNLYSLKIKKI